MEAIRSSEQKLAIIERYLSSFLQKEEKEPALGLDRFYIHSMTRIWARELRELADNLEKVGNAVYPRVDESSRASSVRELDCMVVHAEYHEGAFASCTSCKVLLLAETNRA